MKAHHFGYITSDLYSGGGYFSIFGFDPEGTVVVDDERRIRIQFMKNDSTRIELIEPIDSESPFYSLLKKFKNCFYHICYETENMLEDIRFLRSKGFVQTTKISPAPALGNRNVVFLLSPKIGLIELLEMESNEGIGISV